VQTLESIVRRGAVTYPNRIALIDGNLEWTWNDFDAAVNRACAALQAGGIGPGSRVAACDYNSATYFALYFAVSRLGAILCPLSYLAAPRELEYVISDFEPDLLLAGPEFHDKVAEAASGRDVVRMTGPGAEWQDRLDAADPDIVLDPVDPETVHLVMYTSGTTGRPKGVAHTQAAHYYDGIVSALGYRLNPLDRYLVHAPSFHAASWDHAKIFLVADGSIVLLPKFDPAAALEAITKHDVTVLFGVPAVLKLLMNDPAWPDSDLSSIRMVYYGGALGSPSILTEFAEAIGRNVDFLHVYGLTEGGPFTSAQTPERIMEKPDSIGWPMPGVEMDIVDPKTGDSLPWGEIGEIVVRAPSNMHGYWKQPQATAEALRDGWLHTGDLGRRDDDGDFYIVDRLKDMIRSGGENIYAKEVELALLEHSAVEEAAVVGLPDERWDEKVVAVVQLNTDVDEVDTDELKEFCAEYLARHKLPKEFVFVSGFPRTGLGKISKHILKANLQRAGKN
jgi:acyl-CoA synthetase (AMP-forming)/AMP-acid ligase II